jgi:TPR repeat protein
MHRLPLLCFLLGVAGALVGAPAQAQFYDLNGAYRCLMAPDEKCKQAETPLPPAPPPQPATPSVEEAITNIRAQQATKADIDAIEKQAAAKEPRAVEALAWCKLNGIGMDTDLVAAFQLYGEAADLGVATARSNQVAIFETLLTPEQRQSVLMREQTK